MMAAAPLPIIAPIPETIPLQLRQARRWAPWRAEWNQKKRKYEKIPHRAARPEFGLSNKSQAGWTTFEDAMSAYVQNRTGPAVFNRDGLRIEFSGVGYLMTGPHGVTGVDLDHCRDPQTGVIDEWAAEVLAKLDTYTEVSPSGTGLHAMVAGDVPSDWMNHERGIEVYGGNEARFLCVTGKHVAGSPPELRAPRLGAMEHLAERYRKAPTKAQVEDLHLPDLIPIELIRDLAELDLAPHVANFLTDGPTSNDRSNELFTSAIELRRVGLDPAEMLSVLEANEHAMEIALDHRRQDYDKALRYLWKQCQSGIARLKQIEEEAMGVFDEVEYVRPSAPEDAEVEPVDSAMDDFEALDPIDNRHADLAPVKVPRFTPQMPDRFMLRKPMRWLVKDVLPEAGLAVIYGASTAGKTFLTLDLVAAISRGVEWRGKRVTKGRGVYIVAEGAEGFRNRIQAYCEFHGIDPAGLEVGVIADAPNLMVKLQVDALIEALVAFGPVDYVVVDTYARVMVGGNENDAKDAGLMVAHCARIHKATGAIVILVHHSGKDPASGARGSSVLRAAADVEIEVIRTREYRAARIAKMKDGDDSGEFRFTLPIVELGENEDGDPITSCVVSHQDTPEGIDTSAGEGLKGHAASCFATLAAMMELTGEATYGEALEACIAQIPHEEGKRDRRRDVIVRALEGLIAKGVVRNEDGKLYLQ